METSNKIQKKTLNSPDETRIFEKGKIEFAKVGNTIFGRAYFELERARLGIQIFVSNASLHKNTICTGLKCRRDINLGVGSKLLCVVCP